MSSSLTSPTPSVKTDSSVTDSPPQQKEMANCNAVVEAQRAFFRTGETKSVKFRKQQLQTLKKFVEENRHELNDAVYRDLRRRHEQTEGLEIGMVLQEIDYFLANIDEWSKPTYVQKTVVTMMDKPLVVKDPKGVVLIVSPWNYPVSMILLPLIPAIAAGNTVVIKPSEVSANTAATFEKLLPKYFEAKYLNVVTGGVSETTELLKERFDHILYTGCPPVAKIIMTAAAKHLTPVTLELGGKCPVVVEDDADIDLTARRIAWGKWTNCGQTCLAPDYVICNAAVKSKLLDSFRKYLKEFYGEDIKASKDYSRIINERHFDRLSALLDKTEGAVLFSGGERDRNDLFLPPVILDVKASDPFMHDEIFGPVLPVLTVKDLSEALQYIDAGEKPLAAYIFTRNESKVNRLLRETSSGGITVNDVLMHLTVDTLPFGGVGNSGMGRYRGKFGFDTFTHEKSVLQRGFLGESLISARYPPSTPEKLAMLRRLTGRRIGLGWFGCLSVPVIVASVVFGMILQFLSSRL
ncbi:unnamed protein product [Caenorhabditis auriculariae]|uniref:Aldehyde dehydrogenase n=1 Tax=Caenorhabditis auriculariae TaxID=2777116 RepID=A0A8S1HP74_9PELO|nr:unnamed protein product [Caenorhabditis auriculariae]